MTRIFMGAAGFLFLACLFLVWRLDVVAADRATWKADAEKKGAVIETLRAEAARNEEILSALDSVRSDIRSDNARTRRAISTLEATNAEVRSFLDQLIPSELVGLLWPAASGGDPADAAGGADGALPSAGPRPEPADDP